MITTPSKPHALRRLTKTTVRKSFTSEAFIKPDEGVFPVKKLIVFSLIINLISIISVYLLRNNLPPELPLFYGLAQGEAQLTNTFGLIIPSLISIIIIFLNSSLSLLIKDTFLRQTLLLTAMAVTILSVITTFKIIILVGNF